MKKLIYILLFILPVAAIAQVDVNAFYGTNVARAYGTDTLVGFKAFNTNGAGLAGFIAISGEDTACIASDSINGLTLITGSNSFYWPRRDSTAGYTLATDGSGQLYWQQQDSANGNFDTLTVNNFYFNTTCIPTITGHSNSLLLSNSITNEVKTSNCDTLHYLYVDTLQTGTLIGGGWALTGNAGTDVSTNYIGTSDAEDLSIQPLTGNVGIGTTVPNTKLEITGSFLQQDGNFQLFSNSTSGIMQLAVNYLGLFIDNVNQPGRLKIGDNSVLNHSNLVVDDIREQIGVEADSGFYFFPINDGSEDSLRITFNTDTFKITAARSNLLLKANADADSKIWIDGTLAIRDGTQGDGKLFISDANGVGTWISLTEIDFSTTPAYIDNAAAVAVIGAGKLYYTDVAGEYIVKISH